MSISGSMRQRMLEFTTEKRFIHTRTFCRATALMEEMEISPEEATKMARNQLEFEDSQIETPEASHVV